MLWVRERGQPVAAAAAGGLLLVPREYMLGVVGELGAVRLHRVAVLKVVLMEEEG